MQGAFLNIQVLLVGTLIVMPVMRHSHIHLMTSSSNGDVLPSCRHSPGVCASSRCQVRFEFPLQFPVLQLRSDRGTWHKQCVTIPMSEVCAHHDHRGVGIGAWGTRHSRPAQQRRRGAFCCSLVPLMCVMYVWHVSCCQVWSVCSLQSEAQLGIFYA